MSQKYKFTNQTKHSAQMYCLLFKMCLCPFWSLTHLVTMNYCCKGKRSMKIFLLCSVENWSHMNFSKYNVMSSVKVCSLLQEDAPLAFLCPVSEMLLSPTLCMINGIVQCVSSSDWENFLSVIKDSSCSLDTGSVPNKNKTFRHDR